MNIYRVRQDHKTVVLEGPGRAIATKIMSGLAPSLIE
jgi:hypothetical protein